MGLKGKRVLLVGCGDIGMRLGSLLIDQGCVVSGMRRKVECLSGGIHPVAADYTQAEAVVAIREQASDAVVFTPTPGGSDDDSYRRVYQQGLGVVLTALQDSPDCAVLMSSSTRVFAEADGGWVDESSPLTDTDARAQAIISAETMLRQSAHPSCSVRFAGMYGSGPGRLLAQIRSGQVCAAQPEAFGNRIHRQDCAGILFHLLQRVFAGSRMPHTLIGVDHAPAPRYEVETWLASEMGVTELVHVPPPKRANRRCSNELLTSIGYQLQYPDYQTGYREMLS